MKPDKRGKHVIHILLWGLAAFAILNGPVAAQTPVARGNYLVNTVLTCGNCHTPKGPTGDIMDKAFSGGLSWDEPPFKVTAANITQDKQTGIGNYTDAQLKTLLRKAAERTVEATWKRIGALLESFTPQECANYIANAGYASA